MEVKLEVSIERQQLLLYKAGVLLTKYAVSTSRYGIGNQQGSFKTPLGRHQIISKVGEHAPAYTHFSARVPTQMQWSSATDSHQKDWILARVLCLSGMEPGINYGGQVDSKRRYIYIHGTPDNVVLGQPSSIGCIRMRVSDVIDLFGRVFIGTEVMIYE